MLFHQPRLLPGLARSLIGGKAAVKGYCAEHVTLDPEVLHTCEEVLGFLKAEAAKGSHLVLCTAADIRVARAIASHLGLFDEIIATEDGMNLKGRAKADRLAERFPGGFIYAGDSASDLPVWQRSDGIVLVGVSAPVARLAHGLGKPVLAEFRPRARRPAAIRAWLRALRVSHWSKNVLIFVPLVLAHRWTDITLVAATAVGFVLLLAVTSATYLINDLADLDADRRHATKRMRPVAAGDIPLAQAVLVPVIVLPLSLAGALLLSPWFAAALGGYLALTGAYSFGLKRIPLLDTFVIASLFTMRLLMGTAIMGEDQAVWLFTFSMLFFFSLAMAKRHAELVKAGRGGNVSLRARGYQAEDWPLTLNFGVGAGLGSLVILVLYLVDEAFRVVGYARPEFLWLVTLVVAVWLGRVWLLTHRGRMNDDPVSFALRDRPSYLLAAIAVLCFLVAV